MGAESWSPAGWWACPGPGPGARGSTWAWGRGTGSGERQRATLGVGSPWGSQSQAVSRPRSHLSLKQAFLCWTQHQATLRPVPADLCTVTALLPAFHVAGSSGGLF